MGKKLYFAYGSNMDQNQMKKRCSDNRFLRVVFLDGYEFVYDGHSKARNGSVANIVPKKGHVVYGALYEISEDDENKLDKYEGYPFSYNKQKVILKDKDGNSYEASAYLRKPKELGNPSEDYRSLITSAAVKLGLPAEYINKYLKA